MTLNVNVVGAAKQAALDAEVAARIAAISALRDGVPTDGDTLQKIYNLALGAVREKNVANIAARDAYNIPSLPYNIFVIDDGDGKWAKNQALTTGVGASYIKISDPDLLNAVLSASQIKVSYESNSDTNAYTNVDKALVSTVSNKVDKITGKGLSTEDYTNAEKAKLAAIINGYSGNANVTGSIILDTNTATSFYRTLTGSIGVTINNMVNNRLIKFYVKQSAATAFTVTFNNVPYWQYQIVPVQIPQLDKVDLYTIDCAENLLFGVQTSWF